MEQNTTTEKIRSHSRKLVRQFGFFKSKYQDTQATYGETHAIIELYRLRELEVSELGRLLNIDKPQASKLLKSLDRKGWVTYRTLKDGRKKLFKLTAAGQKAYTKINNLAEDRVQKALNCLAVNEQELVLKGLSLFSASLEKSSALEQFKIKRCTAKEDQQIATIVRKAIKQLGFAGPGTAAADPSLNSLSKFNTTGQCYFVAEKNSKVYGGAGIVKLVGESKEVCELIRMFLHPEARGTGLAQVLIDQCLSFAKAAGYKICYLETTTEMQAAQRLYLRNGFQYTPNRRGQTGHFTCTVLMEKKL